MQKTLFSKYFSICAAMILMSITILGVVLLVFASQYFKEDKFELLTRNATQASDLTNVDFRSNNYLYVNTNLLLSGYTILGSSIQADIFLTNIEGETLLCTDKGRCAHKNVIIEKSLIDAVVAGDFREVGLLSGVYNEAHYSVGIPILTETGEPVAVVFASSSAASLSAFLIEILKMFTISAVTVMFLAFAILYFVTSGMVRPLQNMVRATRSFSKGDFSIRVPVESYDEIGQLAMAFNNMATSLALLESARRSFVANVSHELRTPMTTIGGFIDGILDGTIEEEKRDHYLKIVSDEVKRLSRLVRSMLNIARIEAGELQIKPQIFDINDTVIRTVFTFENAINDKRLEVKGLEHDKVMVEADPDLMHQVVYNLIENAVKFAYDDGYLEFSYTEDDSFHYIGVKNSGEGIPKQEIPRVFERFHKIDRSRSSEKGGAGLGLHIVRSIVNLHGGEIIVRSTEGEYCEFVFTIPKPHTKKLKKIEKAEKNKQLAQNVSEPPKG